PVETLDHREEDARCLLRRIDAGAETEVAVIVRSERQRVDLREHLDYAPEQLRLLVFEADSSERSQLVEQVNKVALELVPLDRGGGARQRIAEEVLERNLVVGADEFEYRDSQLAGR